MQTRLVRSIHFSSAHRYAVPGNGHEANRELYGSWYRHQGFGHNFRLEAFFSGPVDPLTGMVVDLGLVDGWLREATAPLDHHRIDTDVGYFATRASTAENIARYCYLELAALIEQAEAVHRLETVHLEKVRLYEGPDLWIDFGPGAAVQE